MNQIEIVQKLYSDFGSGDIAAILDTMDDSVEWITPGDDALSGNRKGKAGVAEFFGLVAKTWNFEAFEPKQFISSGNQVVAIGAYSARSIATGRGASCDWVMIWTLRNGKIIRFQEFTDTVVLKALLPTENAARA